MPVDLIIVLLVILVVVLMWRGPKTLPKWGEALGRGVKDAKTEAAKAQAEIQARHERRLVRRGRGSSGLNHRPLPTTGASRPVVR